MTQPDRSSEPHVSPDELRAALAPRGRSPALAWRGVPAGARELVLAVEDPDAPGGTFVHWTVFGIPPSARGLPAAGVRQGENSGGGRGWTPPCPPRGDRPHRYVFGLYALRRPSGLRAGARPEAVRAALASGALARGSTSPWGRCSGELEAQGRTAGPAPA